MIYIKILALAIALIIFLRAASYLLSVIAIQRRIKIILLRIFPVVEMFLWISYIFLASHRLFKDIAVYRLLTGSMIIVLIVIVGWYVMRDFISGIILKAEYAFEPGQTIKTSLGSGIITKLSYRSMEIVTREGETIKIPYTLLSSQPVTIPADHGKWTGQVIRIKVSSRYQFEEIQNMLKRRMLEMPWIVSGENIKMEITRSEEESYLAEIHFHSLSPEMVLKTKEILQVFVREVFA